MLTRSDIPAPATPLQVEYPLITARHLSDIIPARGAIITHQLVIRCPVIVNQAQGDTAGVHIVADTTARGDTGRGEDEDKGDCITTVRHHSSLSVTLTSQHSEEIWLCTVLNVLLYTVYIFISYKLTQD